MQVPGLTIHTASSSLNSKALKGNSSTPFASILNKATQNNDAPSVMIKDQSNGEYIQPSTGKLQDLSGLDHSAGLEELKEIVNQLVADGIIPQTLTNEMLETAQGLSWLQMLPEDLMTQIQQLFEENMSIKDLFFSNEGTDQLENMLAGLIYLNHVSDESKTTETQNSLSALFQLVSNQLNLIGKGTGESNQLFNPVNNQLPEELEAFLSQFRTKLTGQQAIAVDTNNDKLEYLKSLFQRTIGKDDGLKNNSLQDSNNKLLVMGVDNQTSINRTGQFALFAPQQASKTVNQEQFIKDFQNILARSALQNTNNGMKLLIKLYPEQLGQLRVELIQQQGVLVARMIASTSAAKEMIESQIQGLKTAFANQNIQVEKLEILNSGSLQQQFERSFEREGSGQGSTSREEKMEEKDSDSNVSFEDAFQEVLMNTEV